MLRRSMNRKAQSGRGPMHAAHGLTGCAMRHRIGRTGLANAFLPRFWRFPLVTGRCEGYPRAFPAVEIAKAQC
ncbi:MAG: hypothetical protein A3D16_02075 [Rhodobacterales bacterium RIFCSPHIGHO2_02_FULL_62_130]|nr:MAG: hypothetical protein A3D16_02075 [Rhodobacterales bacterium RIFCSPHIGHO2_02_FULL_62_130]OHC55574.1 MAG: hypothetical protein A3E48_09330 [Rhodobacterales bacterium RIFCSPHIGHO2_12_FULL_62_75]HCZ01161.1 hypothetical protein [Rhodobacter sp.]